MPANAWTTFPRTRRHAKCFWPPCPTTQHYNGSSTRRWLGTCQDPAQAPPDTGHRPDVDPLSRAAVSRTRRDLPQPSQERHQPFSSLCHSLRSRKGLRYTVALTGVNKGESLKDVVQRLLRQAVSVGVRHRLLLLDRGFYSVAVVRYLQAARYPFLMPVVCHGRSPSSPVDQRQLCLQTWKRSGWSKHTLADAKKNTATVSICVKCHNYRGQWKRHGRQRLIYAYWGYQPPSPDSVFTTYRLRFGIETSYRQLHEGRIRTTKRNPVVRLLYVGIALVLGTSGSGYITRSCRDLAGVAGPAAGTPSAGDTPALVAPCRRGAVRGCRGRRTCERVFVDCLKHGLLVRAILGVDIRSLYPLNGEFGGTVHASDNFFEKVKDVPEDFSFAVPSPNLLTPRAACTMIFSV